MPVQNVHWPHVLPPVVPVNPMLGQFWGPQQQQMVQPAPVNSATAPPVGVFQSVWASCLLLHLVAVLVLGLNQNQPLQIIWKRMKT